MEEKFKNSLAPDVKIEILFRGGPLIPSQEVFDQAEARNPTWVRVLSKAFDQITSTPEGKEMYGDPKGKGATLEQSWAVYTLFGISPYCLLSTQQPTVPTKKIKRVIRLTSRQLVDTLKKLFQASETAISIQYYDGEYGHCLTLYSYDEVRNRFIYHDSWPEDSLLCKGKNAKGIEAQFEPGEGRRWSVSAAELEMVIFAAMVFPQAWARLHGIEFERFYAKWRQEEFYTFFNLSEQEKQQDENGGYSYWLETGGFKGSSFMIVSTDAAEKIQEAKLVVFRNWMDQPQNIPFALDLIKSFIGSLYPYPDEQEYKSLAEMIWSLIMPDGYQNLQQDGPEASQNHYFTFCIIGTIEEASILSEFANLKAINLTRDGKNFIEITFSLH